MMQKRLLWRFAGGVKTQYRTSRNSIAFIEISIFGETVREIRRQVV
jgi:hypothetical protein